MILDFGVRILDLSKAGGGEGGGEGADAGLDGGESVAAGGTQVLDDLEFFKEFGLKGGGVGGGGVVVEFAEERDEAFHERRFGVGAEAEAVRGGVGRAGEPDGGDAAGDAVGVGAVGGCGRGEVAFAGDDDGEAFLRVGDCKEVVEEALLFFAEVQGVLAVVF